MNCYEIIKSRVDICEAAKHYGIKLNRSNKAKCAFHTEKTASLSFSKNKQIFCCFGCGAGGDVVNLVQKLYCLSPHEALEKLNYDFHLGIELDQRLDRKQIIRLRQDDELKKQFENWVKNEMDRLILYFRELHFASLNPDHPKFYEALQMIDFIDYKIQCLEENPLDYYKGGKTIDRRRRA